MDKSTMGSLGYQAGQWASKADAYVSSNPIGRAFRSATLDAVGYDVDFKGQNRGFMGLRTNISEIYGSGRGSSYLGIRDIYKMERAMNVSGGKAAAKALREGGGRAARLLGRTALSSLGVIGTMYFMYSGYQEEGMWGAAKGFGESVAYGGAWRLAVATLGNPVTIGLAVGAAIGMGAYALGEAGQYHARQLRNLELAGDENMINSINSYGANTMRQRASSMLSNSHLNRRFALGNEASLFHSSYR